MSGIAFIGAGRMASAMVGGLLSTKVCPPEHIACTSADDGTGAGLAERTGIRYTTSIPDLFKASDVIVLACKPQQFDELDADACEAAGGKLLISILAGTPISRLAQKFGQCANIVRSMPNTPGQIGAGISCYACRTPPTPEQQRSVEAVLGSLGPVIAVDESDLDAVTAVSGSGPAYLFEFVAALRDGGIAAGLSPEVAYRLALHTALGAAKLLEHTGETPEALRDAVSSPGGTTLAGLGVMAENNFRGIIKDTVAAAKKRSVELAEG